jgi:hypothetical protein
MAALAALQQELARIEAGIQDIMKMGAADQPYFDAALKDLTAHRSRLLEQIASSQPVEILGRMYQRGVDGTLVEVPPPQPSDAQAEEIRVLQARLEELKTAHAAKKAKTETVETPIVSPIGVYDPRSVYGAAAGINPKSAALGAGTDALIDEPHPGHRSSAKKVTFGATDIRVLRPSGASGSGASGSEGFTASTRDGPGWRHPYDHRHWRHPENPSSPHYVDKSAAPGAGTDALIDEPYPGHSSYDKKSTWSDSWSESWTVAKWDAAGSQTAGTWSQPPQPPEWDDTSDGVWKYWDESKVARDTETPWWERDSEDLNGAKPEAVVSADGFTGVTKGVSCSYCKEHCQASVFYLRDTGDWEGGLYGYCKKCFIQDEALTTELKIKSPADLSDSKFKRMCQSRWDKRKAEAGHIVKRMLRGMSLAQLITDINRRKPGENFVEWRKKMLSAGKATGILICWAYESASGRDKKRIETVFQEHQHHHEQIARNPEYVPQYTALADFWVPQRIIEYASCIVPGLDAFHLCRDMTCLSFFPEKDWIQEFRASQPGYWMPPSPADDLIDADPPVAYDLGHYRCSECTKEYVPWKPKEHFIEPNKCLLVSPNGCEGLGKMLGMDKDAHEFFFVIWASTAPSILENRLKEISLQLVDETKDMSYNELMQHVVSKVNHSCKRVYFERTEFSQKNRITINQVNSSKWGDKRKWRYNHLLADGFLRGKAPEFIKGVTPVMNNDDAIANFCYAKSLCCITGVAM